MRILLKTYFSDARVVHTDDPQLDKLTLPAVEIPIMYEAGTPADRSASIVDNSLQFELRNATIPGDREGYYKGRAQLNCTLPDVESVTIWTRLLLDVEAYRDFPKNNFWFTIIELWAGASSSLHPFRISLNIAKDSGIGMPVFLSMNGSLRTLAGIWLPIWSRSIRLCRPPINSWFDLKLSCLLGNYRTGKIKLSMDGQLFGMTNWTYNRNSRTPVPFTMIQPCKLYTSGAVIDHMREAGRPARILWDSLEVTT